MRSALAGCLLLAIAASGCGSSLEDQLRADLHECIERSGGTVDSDIQFEYFEKGALRPSGLRGGGIDAPDGVLDDCLYEVGITTIR
jgi:hypothetical protein